jgi:drug/metabolite transporter (DMT)-like permease
VGSHPYGPSILDARGGSVGRLADPALDAVVKIMSNVNADTPRLDVSRLRSLQLLGVLCGFGAGAWLGAAEAPTKLVRIGVSPVVISLMMVIGVFLARWTVPALIRGTSHMYADVLQAPHLIVWAILAGCLWAVANTLTIYAIRDIGLSIAFPLWNTNSLLGILWGFVFFNELRHAGWRRWLGVVGGAGVMFAGAVLLAVASAAPGIGTHAGKGLLAALGAGILWGTMYIPYRKAYLTGMNPLCFLAFFTIGELGMMSALAFQSVGGALPLWHELVSARSVLFWLLLGGFVWVIGDVFQQYAAKYIGISRGIPLSNTNQLWGLAWGILVFGELHGRGVSLYEQVIGGSLLMAAGAAAIALSSTSGEEHAQWREAAQRESDRYGTDASYVRAGLEGKDHLVRNRRSTPLDWTIVAIATTIFVLFAVAARTPEIPVNWNAMAVLSLAMIVLLAVCGVALWRTTRFS